MQIYYDWAILYYYLEKKEVHSFMSAHYVLAALYAREVLYTLTRNLNFNCDHKPLESLLGTVKWWEFRFKRWLWYYV